MSKVNSNLKLTNIELIFVIMMILLSIIGGIILFSVSTKKQNLDNFKDDINNLIKAAGTSYIAFTKSDKNDYIVSSNDGKTKGMCITINGLKVNDFLTQDYNDWNGYIVIEESNGKKYNYGIWITNQKYVINGYDSSMLEDLDLDKGITKYNNETFTSKVKQEFNGTSGKNGGTGSIDGSSLKKYDTKCINEKVE